MRCILVLMLVTVFQAHAENSYAQNARLSVKLNDVTVQNVLDEIESQSEFFFLFNKKLVDVNRKIEISIENQDINETLAQVFQGVDVDYIVIDRQIVLSTSDHLSKTKSILQSRTINGTIMDPDGEPLIGVSISIKGTSVGTITDAEGKYSLSDVPDDATLVFSFIGMLTQEITAGDQIIINVTMEPDVLGLEEVVVIGYGTQKKVNLTGSVESVEGDMLSRQPIAQASQALTGLVSGLTTIQSSGQPGRDYATLRIRGTGSIGASNNPLILIDGIEGDINGIDANDIADISVLKDAASASIYGSRASNGVILVTTKRAQKGKMTVNYRSYIGWQDFTEKPEFLGALDFLKYSGATQATIDEYAAGMSSNPDKYPDTDWVNLLFTENGFQQYHNLSVNGGTEKLGVLATFSYIDQSANIKSYGYTRYNGRINTDMKFSDKFNINFDINFRKSKRTESVGGLHRTVRQVYRLVPNTVARFSDGSYGYEWGENPIAWVNDGGYANSFGNYFQGVLKANYSPLPGLKFSIMYSPEYGDVSNKNFTRTFQVTEDFETKRYRTVPDRNSLSLSNSGSFTNNLNALATYFKTINNHSFTVLGGYEYIKYQYDDFAAFRYDFILQDYQVLDAGSQETADNSGSATHSGLVSYFARANYSFKDRYLLEANIRRDASSRFAKENRVGVFPSFSAGWRLSEEEFVKKMGLFSNLKLRASWGQLGNQQIGNDFPYVSSIALGSSNYIYQDEIASGAAKTVLANNDIQWETTETTNIGIDAGFFKQRLTFSADYFVRKTKDILLQLPVPLVIGLYPSMRNAGDVENKGWDISANWRNKVGDFSYGLGLHISDVKNEVTNLAGVGPIIDGFYLIEVGSPINMLYGYESIGIFQDQESIDTAPPQFGTLQVGNIQYKDQLTVDTDGDGIPDQADGLINADDKVAIGNFFPRLNYGLMLNAEYKGFDLAIALQGVGKQDVLLGGDLIWPLWNGGKIQEWQTDEFWTPENPDSKYPKILPTTRGSNDVLPSSTWVFDASYLRVRNLTLGYTIPKTILNRIFIKDFRIYFSGQNLFTFHNLPEGFDPLTPNNINGDIYPVIRSYNIGLNVRF